MTAAIQHGMSEGAYFADGALSQSGMRRLLESPKQYRWYVDSARVEKSVFDFGHAVHADVLGVGQPLAEIPGELLSGANRSVSSAEAKAWVAASRERGEIPLKPHEIAAVKRAADAVRAHPKAAWLLGLPGESEVSLFAEDPDTGVALRGRLDRIAQLPDDRLINVDLKTTGNVSRKKVMRHIEDMGYDIQSEVYKHLLRLTHPDVKLAPTHLIFVQDSEPHEVRVVQLAHEDWINGGRARMRRAIALYKQCVETGTWPGDDDDSGAAEAIEPRPYYLSDITLEDE